MELSTQTEVRIRFSEIDPLGIVWHGTYVKYFEDGREAFGEKYGLNYVDYFNAGLITPIVKLDVNYKKDLKYGEKVIVETRYVDSPAAKILFEYKLYRAADYTIVTTGSTTQVFLNEKRQLLLTVPPMFEEWKSKWGII
jgi:acyl-CoA thioester hydrolase